MSLVTLSLSNGQLQTLDDSGSLGSYQDHHIPATPKAIQQSATSGIDNKKNINQPFEQLTIEEPVPDTPSSLLYGLDDVETFPDGGSKAWLVVLGSFMGLIATFGFINSIGALQAYVQENQLKAFSSSNIGWIFSVYLFLSYFGGVFVGPIFDAYGVNTLCLIGSSIYCFSLMMVSLCTEYYQFMLALGVGCGIGTSLLATPMISIVSHWFLRKRGMALGTATVGGSIGGIVFPIMLRALYTKVGFPWAVRILGFICFFCIMCSIVLMKGRLPRNSLKINELLAKTIDIAALKDSKYMFTVAAALFSDLSMVNVITYLASYGLAHGMSISESYLLLSIMNIGGIAGRWGPGYISDKIGRFNTMVISTAYLAILAFGMWLPFGHKKPVLFAFSALYGFGSGGVLTLTPACCGQVCRTEDFGKRYGTMYFVISFSNLIDIPIAGALIGSSGEHYDRFVIYTGLLAVVGVFAWAAARYVCIGKRFLCRF